MASMSSSEFDEAIGRRRARRHGAPHDPTYDPPSDYAGRAEYDPPAPGGGGGGSSPPTPTGSKPSTSTKSKPSTSTRAKPSTSTRSKPSPAAQLMPRSLTVYNSSTQAMQVSALGKAALVFVIIMVGLDIYARATGSTFTLDLLNPTQLFAGSDQSPVTPQQAFTPHATPPSATSPGGTTGGGGHSNQS